MGWLLFWSSNSAECQTWGLSACQWMLRCFYWRGSVGVCLFLLLFNYKGRHLKPFDWWRWEQKCLLSFLPQNLLQCLLLLVTIQSSSQLEWTRIVVYLVLPGSFWVAARDLLFYVAVIWELPSMHRLYVDIKWQHCLILYLTDFLYNSENWFFFLNPKVRLYKYDRHTLFAATDKKLFN